MEVIPTSGGKPLYISCVFLFITSHVRKGLGPLVRNIVATRHKERNQREPTKKSRKIWTYKHTSPAETKDCVSRKLKMWIRISCGRWAEPETRDIKWIHAAKYSIRRIYKQTTKKSLSRLIKRVTFFFFAGFTSPLMGNHCLLKLCDSQILLLLWQCGLGALNENMSSRNCVACLHSSTMKAKKP